MDLKSNTNLYPNLKLNPSYPDNHNSDFTENSNPTNSTHLVY